MGYMPKARFALVVLTLLSLVAGGGASEGAVLDPEELYELRVDNIFFDTFIRDALADISLQTGVPIVADTTVTGFVTLELVDVPLPVALEQLLWPAGYTFRWMDGYYLVGSADQQSPLYHVLSVSRRVKLEHAVAEEVRQALPQAFRDRTQADPATNSLVVTAAEGVVERIVEEIRRLDQPPYQLRIDALVTEINSHGRRTLGLDWSWLDDQRRGIGKGSPADIGNLAGNVLGLSFVLDMRDFLINLRHAVEQGDATIRANPSVVTLEGKPASLFVGNVTYYVMSAGEGAQTTISRLEAIEAGVTLEILARVSDDGVIVLEVAPSVSDVQGSAIQDGTLPVIGRRQVKTTVRVRDGETLALGGLLQQREVEQRTRVPILGDLPIFGRLFSSTRRSQEETEVLVFITPHILRDGEAATQTAMLTTPELLPAYWSN
jgi:Type II secretory pathway, component PulD